ncbi:MAG: DNA alkylation repair protein [Aggregatilineales bacterium]
MTDDYAQDFRDFIHSHPADKPTDGTDASGSSHKHYGLSNPTMRGFVKTWIGAHPDLTYADWESLLTALYRGESVDERSFAGFLLGEYKNFRQMLPLIVLDEWINQLEGWREIDTTCQSNYTAAEVLVRWDAWRPFLIDLSQRETIQHRRASLVLLIKPVRDSEDSRLITTALENVERLKHEGDKLITKAISWILREAIKKHRDVVGAYVAKQADTLPAIAVREFKTKFETGKK